MNATPALPPPAPIQQLHHFAYKAKDAEETRHFYEDLLGLPLYHIIQSDHVPSTGEYCPYTHFFFRLHDGSFIAFFDLGDDEAALPSPNTPAWVNHVAFRVASVADLEAMRARLQAHGVDARARLDAWTARKAQWRQDRAKGLAPDALKPQQNDRPEVAARAASSQPS